MDLEAYSKLRANLAEFIVDNDKLDLIMDKCVDISEHVFSAIVEQLSLGNSGTWEDFKQSEPYSEYNKLEKEMPEVAWIFEWLYHTIGEPNLDYIKEAFYG